MLLVDASAWVLSGIRPDVLFEIGGGDELAVSPPVMSEILTGSRDEVAFQETREMFLRLRILDSPLPLERFEEAARLYMTCRDEGVTVRSQSARLRVGGPLPLNRAGALLLDLLVASCRFLCNTEPNGSVCSSPT